MNRRAFRRHLTYGVIWSQWFVGVWWWSVRKDLTFGAHLGPLYVLWERNPR